MHTPHPLPAATILVAALLLPAGLAHAAASCPLDTLKAVTKATTFGSVSTRDARADTVFQDGCGLAHSRYDLAAGTFGAELDFSCNGTGATRAWDEYTIAGPDPGTPVSFRVELEADVQLLRLPGMYPVVVGSARLSTPEAFAYTEGVSRSAHEVIGLDLVRNAGASFPVRVELGTSTWNDGGHVRVTGALRFTGLPAGASVQSCQGFAGPVVPARPVSWGSLKAIYRE